MQELHAQTIYGMTLPEFTDYFVSVIERAFNPRFEAIESRLDRIEERMDKIESRIEVIEKDLVFIKKDTEDIKDMLQLHQYRFGLIEKAIIHQDRKLAELIA